MPLTITRPEQVPQYIPWLTQPKYAALAADYLMKYANSSYLPQIESTLKSKQPETQTAGIAILGKLGTAGSLAKILPLWPSPHEIVNKAWLSALEQLACPKDIPALQQVLSKTPVSQQSSLQERINKIQALGSTPEPPGLELPNERSAIPIVPPLSEIQATLSQEIQSDTTIGQENFAAQLKAIRYLAMHNDPAAYQELVKHRNNEHLATHVALAELERGGASLRATVHERLNAGVTGLDGMIALESVGQLQDSSLLPMIIPYLKSEPLALRKRAIWAIGEIDTNGDAIDALLPLLSQDESLQFDILRVFAIQRLKVPVQQQLKVMQTLLNQSFSISLLEQDRPEVNLPLRAQYLLMALRRLGLKSAWFGLMPLLIARDAAIRQDALAFLTSLPIHANSPVLEYYLHKAYPEMQLRGRQLQIALYEKNGQVGPANELLQQLLNHPHLAEFPVIEARLRLKKALQNRDSNSRLTELHALQHWIQQHFSHNDYTREPLAVSQILMAIGDVYRSHQNWDNALLFYRQAEPWILALASTRDSDIVYHPYLQQVYQVQAECLEAQQETAQAHELRRKQITVFNSQLFTDNDFRQLWTNPNQIPSQEWNDFNANHGLDMSYFDEWVTQRRAREEGHHLQGYPVFMAARKKIGLTAPPW